MDHNIDIILSTTDFIFIVFIIVYTIWCKIKHPRQQKIKIPLKYKVKLFFFFNFKFKKLPLKEVPTGT